jgi:hypothetical protein
MNIRFTSSLTADDENLIAPAVIRTLSSILSLLPIAYMIRIDTSDAKVYQFSGTGSLSTHALPIDENRQLQVERSRWPDASPQVVPRTPGNVG